MLRKDPFVTGEYYHLYNRGIDKRIIFKIKGDYERFKMLLYIANTQETMKLDNLIHILHKKYEEIMSIKKGEPLVSIGAWCLMDNHFHILVKQETDGGITKFMRKIGVGYSMYFNNKYERQGALFGGPFKSRMIEADDVYLRYLFAYIHLNPLDIEFPNWDNGKSYAGLLMEKFLSFYVNSSYQECVGIKRVENSILSINNFPQYFQPGGSFRRFMKDYIAFKVD